MFAIAKTKHLNRNIQSVILCMPCSEGEPNILSSYHVCFHEIPQAFPTHDRAPMQDYASSAGVSTHNSPQDAPYSCDVLSY